jgi:UDP-N-acetylglucosamine 2-epimerase (non-hydrolysing)
VLVVGDVTSTLACSLVAAKLGVKVVHVEAGLRSFDRSMPEEINRVVTDSISDILFCSEQSGVDNLLREGVAKEKIHLVGNVMIDSLLRHRARAEESLVLEQLRLEPHGYALLTLHRPSNVDDPDVFGRLLDAFEVIGKTLPVVFPIHPRTRKAIESSALGARVAAIKQLRLIDPAGYLDFIKLLAHARVVLTDSGGIQEETTILHVPCLTLRDNTERPITIECGTNQLVGTQPDVIVNAFRGVMNAVLCDAKTPPMWDGNAAQRIVDVLTRSLVPSTRTRGEG